MPSPSPQPIIDFWFEELTPMQWWKVDDALDKTVSERFASIHHAAVLGELVEWRQSALGSLAEVIVLDQFSRNMYRGTPQAFASDSQALTLAQFSIEKGQDVELSPVERGFLYMPFMHSESAQIHEHAVTLFTALGNENQIDFEMRHKDIIDRFGRYPHRNDILGRTSTAEEVTFLAQPGSSF